MCITPGNLRYKRPNRRSSSKRWCWFRVGTWRHPSYWGGDGHICRISWAILELVFRPQQLGAALRSAELFWERSNPGCPAGGQRPMASQLAEQEPPRWDRFSAKKLQSCI